MMLSGIDRLRFVLFGGRGMDSFWEQWLDDCFDDAVARTKAEHTLLLDEISAQMEQALTHYVFAPVNRAEAVRVLGRGIPESVLKDLIERSTAE